MPAPRLISAEEFCIHHQVEIGFIHSLQEYGLIEIISEQGNDYLDEEKLNELEKMVRLHYELDINMEGIDVIRHLLKKLETMQDEIVMLKNRLRIYESQE